MTENADHATSELVGTRERPYVRVPPDFSEDGLPWGAFCRCSRCGFVERSTNIFDYYPDVKTGLLVCGQCAGHDSKRNAVLAERMIADGEQCDPLGPGCRGGYSEDLSEPPSG